MFVSPLKLTIFDNISQSTVLTFFTTFNLGVNQDLDPQGLSLCLTLAKVQTVDQIHTLPLHKREPTRIDSWAFNNAHQGTTIASALPLQHVTCYVTCQVVSITNGWH
jgi:hypothetical protein